MNGIAQGMCRAVAVAGGKGGVGKTTIALNLALGLCRAGRRVMLLDADLGLGNVDIMLGLEPRYNLGHLLRGQCSAEAVVTPGPHGLGVVPAASGVAAMARLAANERAGLIAAVRELAEDYDFLVVDTPPGINPQALTFSLVAERILLVLVNEPAALTDAYGLVKVLARDHHRTRFEAISNQVGGAGAGRALYRHFSETADRFLDVSLGYLGAIPDDPLMKRAGRARKPLLDYAPGSPSAAAISALAGSLLAAPAAQPDGLPAGRAAGGESI